MTEPVVLPPEEPLPVPLVPVPPAFRLSEVSAERSVGPPVLEPGESPVSSASMVDRAQPGRAEVEAGARLSTSASDTGAISAPDAELQAGAG